MSAACAYQFIVVALKGTDDSIGVKDLWMIRILSSTS